MNMPRFDNRDVAFDSPEGWEDRTVIAFEAPKGPRVPYATNVTLMSVESKPISPGTFATQQVANLSAGLPKFDLLSQKNASFGGLPAIELLYNWAPPDGAITQRMTIFERGGKIWSFTCSALRSAFQQNLPMFDRIAASIQFAGAAPPGSPAGTPSSQSGGSLPPLPEKPRGW